MLLQPFAGALIVLHSIAWPVIPALTCVLLVFLIREPLVVLARQAWIWRDPHPETFEARRQLWRLAPTLALAGLFLFLAWPWWIVAAMGAGAVLLTWLAVWMTLQNRQRAAWFQVVSATGLSSSCVVACLAVTGAVPAWCWWWWALHSVHFLASILVVHVRLEARIQSRRGGPVLSPAYLAMRREAVIAQALLLIGAVVLATLWQPFYAAAAVLSGLVHLRDLYSAHMAEAIAMPMMQVGRRALAVSIGFTLLMVAGALL